MATNHTLEAEIPVTSERPARLTASLDSVVSVRVFLHNRGAPTASDRPVGQLSVPVREMTEFCGHGIYQTWFVLEAPEPYGTAHHGRLVERFRQALQTAPQEPHAPRICISLLDAALPNDWGKVEEDRERVMLYSPLLVSHKQHSKLTRAYFDHLAKLSGSTDKHRRSGARAPPDPADVHSELERLHQRQREEEVDGLRRELDQMTEEANRRIERGNESIVKLKADLKQMRDEEAPELQRERDEAAARLEAAKQTGNSLRARLDKTRAAGDEASEDEVERLRQEAQVLGKQKAALMKMVQDVYGKGGGADSAPPDASQQLLPSPKELLGNAAPTKPL